MIIVTSDVNRTHGQCKII